MEPTGSHQTSRVCLVIGIEGARIKECRQYFDSRSLMQQLGLMPPAAAA
jgi:limonene-1,2-epoxide hydrolase